MTTDTKKKKGPTKPTCREKLFLWLWATKADRGNTGKGQRIFNRCTTLGLGKECTRTVRVSFLTPAPQVPECTSFTRRYQHKTKKSTETDWRRKEKRITTDQSAGSHDGGRDSQGMRLGKRLCSIFHWPDFRWTWTFIFFWTFWSLLYTRYSGCPYHRVRLDARWSEKNSLPLQCSVQWVAIVLILLTLFLLTWRIGWAHNNARK